MSDMVHAQEERQAVIERLRDEECHVSPTCRLSGSPTDEWCAGCVALRAADLLAQAPVFSQSEQEPQEPRDSMTHDLKCWPTYFHDVRAGRKRFEVRQNDRDYRVGDQIRLREWAPSSEQYTGAEDDYRITYVTDFGQTSGQVVLGIEPVSPSSPLPQTGQTESIRDALEQLLRYDFVEHHPADPEIPAWTETRQVADGGWLMRTDVLAAIVSPARTPAPQTGASLIAAERDRQINVERWSATHDDAQHWDGALVAAARTYAHRAEEQATGVRLATNRPPSSWPWEPHHWKPSENPVRNLVKAGALLAAEIDRWLRRESSSEASPPASPRCPLCGEVDSPETVCSHGFHAPASPPEAQRTERHLAMQMFSDGVNVARSYGNNAFHLWGEQLRRQFDIAWGRWQAGENNVTADSANPEASVSPVPSEAVQALVDDAQRLGIYEDCIECVRLRKALADAHDELDRAHDDHARDVNDLNHRA